jgi:hypothetical protein
MASSIIVPITKYNALSLSYYQIDDRLPDVVLAGHINESEYVQICQQVQTFLRPINIARNLFRGLYVASVSLFGLAIYVSFQNSVATLSTVVALAIILVLVGFCGPLLIIPRRTKKAFQSIKSLCIEQSSRFNNDSFTESFEVTFHLCDGLNVTPKNFAPDDHTFSSFKTYHNIYVSIDVKNKHFLLDLEIGGGSSSSLLQEKDIYASEWTLESILSKDDDSHTVSTIDIDYDANNDDFDGELVERSSSSSSSRSNGNKKARRKTKKKRKKSRRYESQYEPSDLEKELRDILRQQEQEDKGKSRRNKGKATRRKSRRRSVDDDPSIV